MADTTQVLDVLALAYAHQERGRVKWDLAVDAQGYRRQPADPEATRWCALGALYAAMEELACNREETAALTYPLLLSVEMLLDEAVGRLQERAGVPPDQQQNCYTGWHDQKRLNKKDALELWGEAASLVGNK